MKTSYRVPNSPITGMSDAEFYGRESAIGIDLSAATRAAAMDVKFGLDCVLNGDHVLGTLLIRRARVALAIAMGNETRAAETLAETAVPLHYLPPGHPGRAAGGHDADKAELEHGLDREHALPVLVSKLAAIEAAIAAERSAS